MKLHFAAGSPFVRKVTVAAIETGLDGRIERVPADFSDPAGGLARDNPLGRVPTLIADDGRPVIESSVICAWLDEQHDGPRIVPADPEARRGALWLEALADGLTESAIQVQRERARPPEKHWDEWEARNRAKVERTMDVLEDHAALLDGPLTVGQIALGCGMGWTLLRLPDLLEGWQARWPRVAAWYDGFSRRPSMQATQPK